jgi:hypothetical protein
MKISNVSRAFKVGTAPLILAAMLMLAQPAAAKTCNRECLTSFISQYLNALVAHKPDHVPVTADVKFTEDKKVMKLGDGLWQTVTGLGTYRLDILDVRAQMAATQVIAMEGDNPVQLVVRLKIENGKISEIETLVAHNKKEAGLFDPDNLKEVDKNMLAVPPKSEVMSRTDAIKAALHYPAGLQVGSFVQVDAPFAPDAYRLEGGVHTAGPGCTRAGCEDIKKQTIMKHPGVITRVAVVDEQLGIVLLRINFGYTGSYGPNNALEVWEAFKVYGGQIHAVNAFMKIMPVGVDSGWDAEYPAFPPGQEVIR